MSDTDKNKFEQLAKDWWRTDIIDMEPNRIRFRGYAIEELIGSVGFSQMIWLMLRGDIPDEAQASLLEAALVAGVDHGPQAPSIAIARMAATCGVDLNNAMASALNVLGDVHGGAGEQAVIFYESVRQRIQSGEDVKTSTSKAIDAFITDGGKYIPGFGHRFHTKDPRSPRLLELVDVATQKGKVSGIYAEIGRAIETELTERKSRPITMNIDGATAVIYAELGFPAALARGLFCLSRQVGILAHAWEQKCQGGRNKGPLPKGMLWTYGGEDDRNLKP